MLDYEAKTKEQTEFNKRNLINRINDKVIVEKIQSFCEDKHWPIEYVQELIMNGNEDMISRFAISSQRQSNHQMWAAEYIKTFKNVSNFKVLPQSGTGALFVNKGVVESAKSTTPTKAIDFYFEVDEYKFYCSHKYTKQLGGAQDNQYNDLKMFMEHAKDNTNTNSFFIAICDGAYYQSKEAKYSKEKKCIKTKQEYMNEVLSSKRTLALTIEELKEFIERI